MNKEQTSAPSLSDAEIDSVWQALPGIELHNEAAARGLSTNYVIRLAFARAILAHHQQDAEPDQDPPGVEMWQWVVRSLLTRKTTITGFYTDPAKMLSEHVGVTHAQRIEWTKITVPTEGV